MHYKNGREAKEGDNVIAPSYTGGLKAGVLFNLQAACTSCNATLASPVPGSVYQECVTVGDCLHIEDAHAAWLTLNPIPQPAPAPQPQPETKGGQ